jgi:ABC-type transport system involved in multi-copper enzyme maturation permease subunit
MTSNAITEKTEGGASSPGGDDQYKPVRETAPSVMAAEEPTVARTVGIISLCLALIGAASLGFYLSSVTRGFGPFWGGVATLLGVAGMLYHAVRDSDLQIRRAYNIFGLSCVIFGVITAICGLAGVKSVMLTFLPTGYTAFVLGLLFLIASVRHETDLNWRKMVLYAIGGLGLIFAALGFVRGFFDTEFLLGSGVLLAILGLAYLWSFIVMQGSGTELGYGVGLGVGVIGLLVIIVAVGRSFLPQVFYHWGWLSTRPDGNYLEQAGVLLMLIGFLYTAVATGLCSDSRFIVLTRREMAAFFYSPLAYVILLCFTIIAGIQYLFFIAMLGQSGVLEPVVFAFITRLFIVPALAQILVIPLLTMRLLSEERRSATMEVLLTAPVNDAPVVWSKFIAVLVIYVLTWLPYGLFLLALRMEAGTGFDYRPVLSFVLALIACGGNYLGMGLFFSSLTRNQVVAGFLSAIAMVAVLVAYIGSNFAASNGYPTLGAVLNYMSYIELWTNSLRGKLYLRDIVFHSSMACFWVYLTIQVLNARRWR